ncbi:unnamed protein product [Arctia plantaginis]|uniref:Uncharacterized protein n=1 Tax=Arctia plantaginis TaxID=874455 RepID=A0A8S1B9U1_ARCPL|nr:unnamed protein product [Arctia plantaginis]CAB3254557.1 unnamed protein product [Arctia plantaginis]
MVPAKIKRSFYRDFSGYVNVCAAVCLLLLVGGLSPRSSAAPHRNRASMERQRRAADEENGLWANPCDYSDSSADQTTYSPTHVIALKLAKQALFAYNKAYNYSEKFAKLHTFPNFSAQLLRNWETQDWLRKTYADALPKEKVFNKKMPDEYIEEVIANIDQKLPSMYMGLKMVVAGLYTFSQEGLNYNVANDDVLKENITRTMHDVRAVLCYFNEIMNARNLEIRPLLDKDVPSFTNDNSFGLLLYRDTLNYMDYLEQVFSKLAEKGSKV